MANSFKTRANRGTIHLDPSIVGLITLMVTVTSFCIFLLCLKRGTPQLWPYATTVLPRSQFTITPTEEPNSLPVPLFEPAEHKKWQLTVDRTNNSFYTPPISHDTIYVKPTRHGITVTVFPEWNTQTQTSQMYSQCTSLAIGKNKTIFTGGIVEPLYSPEFIKYSAEPTGTATKATWIYTSSSVSPKKSSIQEGPSMRAARASHNLCKMNNGNILISGGISESRPSIFYCSGWVNSVQTLEKFQLKENRIIELGQMQIPRYQHTVSQLQNGNFLIVSGRTGRKISDSENDLTATVEVFSPKTKKSWIIGQLHRAMVEPILLHLKDNRIAIIDSQSLKPEQKESEPYVEIYNGNQEPVQKLTHLPSVPELIHSLWHWND
jgi:hypothetical protein